LNEAGSDSLNSLERECPDESGLVNANEELRIKQMVPRTPYIDARDNNFDIKKGKTKEHTEIV